MIVRQHAIEPQELNRNGLCFKRSPGHEPPLKLRRSRSKEKHKHKNSICIITSWKKAQSFPKDLELMSVSRNFDDSATVMCTFDKTLFKRSWDQSWITMRTRIPVFEEELITVSKCFISRDQFHVTILGDSVETLLEDIETNLRWFGQKTHVVHKCIQQRSVPPVAVPLDYNHSDFSVARSPICRQELSLNKGQVTFLIGKNGSRIERIRQVSQATIKVLPISKRLTSRELNHPDIVNQLISITGNSCEVALAFAYIETYLQLHRLGPRRMSLYP